MILQYMATSEQNVALEFSLHADDNILKFITLRHDDDDDIKLELKDATVPTEQKIKPDALDIMLGLA